MNDIDKLEAGRKLDAMVAVEIFGFTRSKDEWYGEHPTMGKPHLAYASVCIEVGSYQDIWGDTLPKFSSRIVPAWAVVEKMALDKFSCIIEWKGADRGYPLTAEAAFTGNRLPTFHAAADTAPLAICKAALRAARASPAIVAGAAGASGE